MGEKQFPQEPASTGNGVLAAAFDVTGLAVSSMSAAAGAIARLVQHHGSTAPDLSIDSQLASFWFGASFKPVGWELPPVWDSIAGTTAAPTAGSGCTPTLLITVLLPCRYLGWEPAQTAQLLAPKSNIGWGKT